MAGEADGQPGAFAPRDEGGPPRGELVRRHAVARADEKLSQPLRGRPLGALRIDRVDADQLARQVDGIHGFLLPAGAPPDPKYAARTCSSPSRPDAVPCATTRPCESTYPRCAMASVWCTFCSTRKTVTPCSLMRRITAKFSITNSGVSPRIDRMSVVLPEPFEPSRQVMLPRSTVRETSCSTSARSYAVKTLSTRSSSIRYSSPRYACLTCGSREISAYAPSAIFRP